MHEDSNVYFVKVLLRCCNSAGTAFKNRTQSLHCESFPFTDEPTGSCGPDKQATCIPDQRSDNVFARPARIQRALLPDESQIVFQEDRYIVVYSRRRYVMEYKVLVRCIRYLAEPMSNRDFRSTR